MSKGRGCALTYYLSMCLFYRIVVHCARAVQCAVPLLQWYYCIDIIVVILLPCAVVLEPGSLLTFAKGFFKPMLSHFLGKSTAWFVWLLCLFDCCLSYPELHWSCGSELEYWSIVSPWCGLSENIKRLVLRKVGANKERMKMRQEWLHLGL